MISSEIHQHFGPKGLFEGMHAFEAQSYSTAFQNTLLADAKEFMAVIGQFFQSAQFSYQDNTPNLEAYHKQRERLRLYNRLLNLYFNKKLTVELAFVKAMALLERCGMTLPKTTGRLSALYKEVKALQLEKMLEQLANQDDVDSSTSNASWYTRLLRTMFKWMMKVILRFSFAIARFRR